MYYIENMNKLGEEKTIVYSNMYINHLQLGCKYNCQDSVNNLCPSYLKNNFEIPKYFKDIFNDL
jgi:hypothetical protein